jgi:hypothetical protein
MFDRINLMVPSYKRPAMLRTFIDSALETATNEDNLCWTILLNEKDDSYKDFVWPINCCILKENSGEPNLSAYFNQMYNETAHKGDDVLVTMLGDDMAFETSGWDVQILAKINEKNGIGIVHCEDGFCSHGACPVNIFTTRKFVEACGGEFMCSAFKRFWMDEIWGRLADMAKCNYFLPNVVVKHNHTSGKNSHDETFRRLENMGVHEMAGGIDVAREAIWPFIEVMYDNLLESGLI